MAACFIYFPILTFHFGSFASLMPSAIISVRSIVINRGQSVELDGSNSYAVEDQVNAYEWETVE